ncbi:MAG: DNA primase [Bacteroidetes bacterium]|jgi:DNA primase|nr:DNA primase [Bacteroidota bacterium]
MIDQATIQRIYDAADIVDVIGDFVNLKKSGQNYRGHSPFTNERTPSFFVSPSKGIFKCFSSGTGGNVVKFLMEHEKLTYPEALKFLAKKYNIEVVEKELSAEEIKEQNERESLLTVTNYAQKYFTDQLFNSEEGNTIGLKYFKERGFRENTLHHFQLGYSPDQWDAFTQHAKEKGYKTDYLVSTGLSIEKNDKLFDRFHGRVMFPIHSLSGQIIGFGGRILKKDDKAAKYLNSPESSIYHKSNVLYGIYFAKNSIVKQNKCFLVEGYTDVLSMHQNGIENVVASSGTALTAEQIRLVKRFTPNITIIYDGDAAGLKASMRGIDIVLEEGMNVKVVLLPEGEDPDSFAQSHGQDEFLSFIETHERDFITFKTNLLLKDAAGDPVKRSGLIQEIVRSIAVIPEGITRSVYIRECARSMDIQEDVLYAEVNKIRREKAGKKAKQDKFRQQKEEATKTHQAKQEPVQPEFNVYEKDVIRLLLNFGNNILFDDDKEPLTVARFIVREIEKDELSFSHAIYQEIFSAAKEMIENNNFEINYFTKHPNENITHTTVEFVTPHYNLSKIWSKNDNYIETEDMRLKEIVPEALIALKKDRINQMLKDNEQQIKNAQLNADQELMQESVQRHQILTQVRMELYKELGSIM